MGDIKMAEIEFSAEEKGILVEKIKLYFEDELDQDIKQFEAEFLLDFFAEQVGPCFYNRGLYDAHALMEAKLETISEGMYEIEKPTEFRRGYRNHYAYPIFSCMSSDLIGHLALKK